MPEAECLSARTYPAVSGPLVKRSKTLASHAGNSGSNPLRVTKKKLAKRTEMCYIGSRRKTITDCASPLTAEKLKPRSPQDTNAGEQTRISSRSPKCVFTVRVKRGEIGAQKQRFPLVKCPAARQPVPMTMRSHPFPSRTRQLSSSVPKILGGQPPGKIGRCRHKKTDYRF